MTLYESNFVKLKPLLAELDPSSTTFASTSTADCDLYLEIVAGERYTTTLTLTYWFDADDDAPVADPDMSIRVYHDARLVEAVAGRQHHHHHKLRELARAHRAELGRRWRRNVMLNKWLDYLLDMGHRFEPVAARAPRQSTAT